MPGENLRLYGGHLFRRRLAVLRGKHVELKLIARNDDDDLIYERDFGYRHLVRAFFAANDVAVG